MEILRAPLSLLPKLTYSQSNLYLSIFFHLLISFFFSSSFFLCHLSIIEWWHMMAETGLKCFEKAHICWVERRKKGPNQSANCSKLLKSHNFMLSLLFLCILCFGEWERAERIRLIFPPFNWLAQFDWKNILSTILKRDEKKYMYI